MKRIEQEEAKEKKSEEGKKSEEAAPAALLKLDAKGGDVTKLFVPEMKAIAFTHFMHAELKGKKADCAKQLVTLIQKHPSILPAATTAARAAASTTETATDPAA